MRLIVLTMTTLLLSLKQNAADLPIQALQDATSQQVLSERIARVYAWRSLEGEQTDAHRQQKAATTQFSKQLDNLRKLSGDDAELKDNYALLAQLWADYQKLTDAPSSRHGATKLAELSEEVSWFARKGRVLVAQRLGIKPQAGSMAADIAMLSQRLAKTYLLQVYGLKQPFLPRDLAETRHEFNTLSRQLKALPDNDVSVKAQLALMEQEWFFFQHAIDELAKNNTDPQLRRNVITTSDRIYQVAIDLAGRYERRGKV
ncbi:hypothetical protein [Chitinimonas sp. BJB300]|uniref:hypothetical protein n=1 Tax=Chitinimonas sp. BJB300 TaxID=1559339 RepID=UPI000C0CE897|nr:hypothetical protein [Chitinimonas sp. BJB300]PHV09867.1 hypothetical protein CSQ89_19305 [Chitinimonas sp. BJB300]TSJ87568.1 hypothetical protein FG002_013680 [Chitinimonas sp. BJB300]